MRTDMVSTSQVADGVDAFNGVYADMDRVLWFIADAAREQLVKRTGYNLVDGLIWTIRSWWGVQGVRREDATAMAEALTAEHWSTDMFSTAWTPGAKSEAFACEAVPHLVMTTVARGARRQEFSLASKALHWLMPWRVPVYDSFVRTSVGVPGAWGHPDAYRDIVRWQFKTAAALMKDGTGWVGNVDPKSPFRALDKYLWWIGGGSNGRAVMVKQPWKAAHQLGLSPHW